MKEAASISVQAYFIIISDNLSRNFSCEIMRFYIEILYFIIGNGKIRAERINLPFFDRLVYKTILECLSFHDAVQ